MNAPVALKNLMNETPLLDNRLLILEDDRSIAEWLRAQAEGQGLIGFIAANKDQFREAFLRLKPSLLILDIILGDEDVIPVIDFLANEGCKCPVFFPDRLKPGINETGFRKGARQRVDDGRCF